MAVCICSNMAISKKKFVTHPIMSSMTGQERGKIKAKLKEAGIPDALIKELLPVEGPAAGAEGAAAGAASAAGAPKAEKKEAPAKEKR